MQGDAHVKFIVEAMIFFWVLSVGVYIHLRISPEINTPRRIFCILIDQIFSTLCFAVAGEHGTIFAFVWLWVSVGNGIRFGIPFMAFASTTAVVCILSLVYFSDYWSTHLPVAIGLIISNITVPGYVTVLMIRLQKTKNQLEHKSKQLEELASLDRLTGLPNRSAFFNLLEDAIEDATATNRTFAVVYMDLDGFKSVNDSYGHSVGDDLLIKISQKMKGSLRATDTVSRLGGDEFAAILDELPQKNPEQTASLLCHRIIEAISDTKEVSGRPVKVGVSIGMLIYPFMANRSATAEELVRIADESMYLAKRSGKNKVIKYAA